MKHLLIIAALLVAAASSAQTNFEKGMQKALSLWEADNWTEAEQLFERIAAADPNEWLPNYYVAQMNSAKTWEEKDPKKVKAQLDKAQDYLNVAMSISKDNPEIIVLQAHVLTNWIAFDGMTYGMKYSAKITELYAQAYKLAPDNPRVVFNRAEWNMGSAKYFGQDTQPFCKDIEKSIELFTNFKPKSAIDPNWGKDRAVAILASCNK